MNEKEEEFVIREVMDNTQLRYAANLHQVEWMDLLNQELPLVKH